jgi:hypothetical protein
MYSDDAPQVSLKERNPNALETGCCITRLVFLYTDGDMIFILSAPQRWVVEVTLWFMFLVM